MSRFYLILALSVLAGCRPAGTTIGPALELPPGPAVRVLFLGNSLTASNDVPALVQSIAAAGGVRLEYESLTPGGTSLEDHWQGGMARDRLAQGRFHFVVLQQGPSTRDDSRENLKEWASTWSNEARQHGTRPAVYMIWPPRDQKNGFELVSRSYREAAEVCQARLLPAGDAWQLVRKRDPSIELFSQDNFHPSLTGSYLAALVIAHGLTGVSPQAAPSRLTLGSGQVVELPEAQAKVLRQAAASVGTSD